MRSHLAFFVLLLLPAPALRQDTPMFRANFEHIGVYGAFRSSPASNGNFKPTGASFLLAPLNGLVYVGSMDKNLFAVDQQTSGSSGSLLPKVRWYLLRRWRGGLFISLWWI
jgi:hypothetical protein